MGKKILKGTKGKASNLVRESQLQEKVALADLDDFRRMCILRGVYPKENPKERDSPFANFHKKDISMINSDPMTWFIREHASWLKKRERKLHRKELDTSKEPTAPYAELIRSRYPTFGDAVQELDDALTTIALFAQLKGNNIIPSERINRCRELLTEFHYYVSHTHSLKCAFISVRGFHFETTIEGQSVLWLVPHEFPIPEDSEVDYKVLLHFLELYEQLLKFVNTKLFIELGMKYPPEFDQQKWNDGLYFDAIKDTRNISEDTQMAAPAAQDDAKTDKLKAALASASTTAAAEAQEVVDDDRGLFGNFLFTICSGTPRNSISFVIRSLGGGIIWDEESDDKRITHTITDRGEIETRFLNRKYIQSQWVVDCLNKKELLDVGIYAPNVDLPPHVSPWDVITEQIDGIDQNDEREIIAGGDDSDAEIDEEIKRAAMEADFAEGIAAESGIQTSEQQKQSIAQMKAEMKKKKKEEKERLAAGTLTVSKMKLYQELKEKEASRKKSSAKKAEPEENEKLDDTVLEEEEEEEANEK
ncbi:Pescadillo like protein [Tritrichomonas foetus]|uniref:Pescadillo like protein n=1 Tax=Tritrichomonas foetus TaxID=1144522 RepID=A0A1J4J8Y1_9EUKA|nr:Pescadillo like protein [Tritrichomonas foetus]|eukprot:OHS95145.1 Pescadillo like protein [Tritrichomonas foetus]